MLQNFYRVQEKKWINFAHVLSVEITDKGLVAKLLDGTEVPIDGDDFAEQVEKHLPTHIGDNLNAAQKNGGIWSGS